MTFGFRDINGSRDSVKSYHDCKNGQKDDPCCQCVPQACLLDYCN